MIVENKILDSRWRWFSLASALGVVILLISYHLFQGLVTSPDSSTYSRWADLMIHSNYNFIEYWHASGAITRLLYAIPVSIIGFHKELFYDSWTSAFFLSNLASLAVSLFVIYRMAFALRISPMIIGFLFPLFLVSVDFLVWPRYILTDTLFTLFYLASTPAAILLFNRSEVDPKPSRFGLSAFLLLMVLLLMSRPSSPPYIAALTLAVAMLFTVQSSWFKADRQLLLFGFVVIAAAGGLLVTALWMQRNGMIDAPQLRSFSSMYYQGMVVHDRPETWLKEPQSWLELYAVYLWRVAYFWSPTTESFSKSHIFFNVALWLAFGAGLIAWLVARKYATPAQRYYVALLWLTIIAVTIYQSATVIDYDWRYRYPLIGPLILFVMVALQALLNWNTARKKP